MSKKKSDPKTDKKEHPCHMKEVGRVRRIKVQVEGIERMINEHRYCPDIITQIRAARAALKSLEASVLETHFGHCVADAAKAGSQEERSRKIQEIMDLFIRS